jgi:hypothetical protein
MGGDACHHAGEFRETEYLPLPDTITPSLLSPLTEGFVTSAPVRCSSPAPFALYNVAVDENGKGLVNVGAAFAQNTIKKAEEIDPSDEVLVIMVHDARLKMC